MSHQLELTVFPSFLSLDYYSLFRTCLRKQKQSDPFTCVCVHEYPGIPPSSSIKLRDATQAPLFIACSPQCSGRIALTKRV